MVISSKFYLAFYKSSSWAWANITSNGSSSEDILKSASSVLTDCLPFLLFPTEPYSNLATANLFNDELGFL